MYDTLIRNGNVVMPTGIERVDLGIRKGKIVDILPSGHGEEGIRELDVTSRYVFPGGIDVHVHMDDLGAEEMEEWQYGSLAAAQGGITTVADMPIDCNPVTTDRQALRRKLDRIQKNAYVDYLLWGGLTAENLSCIEGMIEDGAAGLKAFLVDSGAKGFCRVTAPVLLEAMKKAVKENFPIVVHAESEEINQYYTEKYKDSRSWTDWSKMRPEESEWLAVSKCLLLARITGARVHIAHVSSARTIQMIAEAKRKGVRVTCETCPHYLLFSERDYEQKGAQLKCAPPVRGEHNRKELWKELKRGNIDMISSDHSPCVPKEKNDSIKECWAGISGIQMTFLAMYSEGVCKGRITPVEMAGMLSENPAELLGIARQKGSIETGKDADLVILNPFEKTVFTEMELKMKVKQSIYKNDGFCGRIEKTFLRGTEVVVGNPEGRFICR